MSENTTRCATDGEHRFGTPDDPTERCRCYEPTTEDREALYARGIDAGAEALGHSPLPESYIKVVRAAVDAVLASRQPAPTVSDLTDAGLVDLYWLTTNDDWPIPADVMIRYGRAVLAAHREVRDV